jgi:hypothetical protein
MKKVGIKRKELEDGSQKLEVRSGNPIFGL